MEQIINKVLGGKFKCGLCNYLALDPMVHDGGNRRRFCTKIYCSTCCYPYSDVSTNQFFNNKARKMEVKCPGACPFDFRDPYFRYLSVIERELYESIIICCEKCNNNFGLKIFHQHFLSCGKSNVPKKTQVKMDQFLKPNFDQLALKRKELQLICNNNNNDFKLFFYEDCIDLVHLNVRSLIDLPQFQVDQKDKTEKVINSIRTRLNIKSDLDLVWVEYRCASQYETIGGFLRSIPVESIINMIPKRKEIAINDRLMKIKYLGSFGGKKD